MIVLVFLIFTLTHWVAAIQEYNCDAKSSTANTNSLQNSAQIQPQISVIVCWRESVMVTPRVLREILEHDVDSAFEVIYVHVDLAIWRSVLDAACDMQREFGSQKLRIVTTPEHVFPDKFTMFRRGAAFARSSYVLFNENNSLGFDDKQVAKMLAVMKSTKPTPSILTSVVFAIVQGKPVDHHPAMRIVVHSTDRGTILRWTGFDGRPDDTEHEQHTFFRNSNNYTVLGADLVEPHTFLIDTTATNVSAVFDSAPHVAVMIGVAAWRSSGRQPAIASDVKTTYLYPQEELHILDVPIVIARWAIHESLSSVRYLEKRWGALYKNQCGQTWHTVSALNYRRFLRAKWPELGRRATSVILSAMWLYVFHITHVSCRITWRNGTESTLARATASELLMSLSELTDDIDTRRIVSIDAYAEQNHVVEPTLQPHHVGDDLWLRARVKHANDIPRLYKYAFPDANHCMYRPVFVRLTCSVGRRANVALDSLIDRLMSIALVVQSDGDELHALVSVRSASMDDMELWIEQTDSSLRASGIGRLERVRIKMGPPVNGNGKWAFFNATIAFPPASDETSAIPLLRPGMLVDSIGPGRQVMWSVSSRDVIERWFQMASVDVKPN
jgi:hypothetical protein